MLKKKSLPGLAKLLGCLMLASFVITGCNNEGEKKIPVLTQLQKLK